MAKIKITEKQARILEGLSKGKVIKITEKQLKKIVESESFYEGAEIPQIVNGISKVNPSDAIEYKKNISSETKIKNVIHEGLWEEFINELYGLNESNQNKYDKLIKLMEMCGYVENRKLSKSAFNNDKNIAKNVILSGLNKMNEYGSPYMAMEEMEKTYSDILKSFKSQLDQTPKNKYSKEQKELAIKVAQERELERRKSSGEIKEIDGEETEETNRDEVDTITMDVPLFIRTLEYSREDAKNDVTLHDITQKAIELNKQYSVLNMGNYYEIFGGDENTGKSNQETNDLTSVDEIMYEESNVDGVVGMDILNYEPFSNLPDNNTDITDYKSRIQLTLPSIQTPDANTTIFSKSDLTGSEVQGPKMVHKFSGYISDFKNKFGEEPIFIEFNTSSDGKTGGAKIANQTYLDWKTKGDEAKMNYLSSDRKDGRTYGLDEFEIDETTTAASSGQYTGSAFLEPIKKENEEKIYEALDALKKKSN